MDGNFVLVITAGAATFTVGGGLLTLGWFMSKQFHNVGYVLGEKLDLVEKALEARMTAHEKLDDERFNALNIAQLKLELRREPSDNGLPKSPYQV